MKYVRQRKTNTWHHLHVGAPKNDANVLIYTTETDSQTLKANLWLPKGKDWGRGKSGVGTDIYTRPHTSWIIIKYSPQSTRDSTQRSVTISTGKESEEVCIHVYV